MYRAKKHVLCFIPMQSQWGNNLYILYNMALATLLNKEISTYYKGAVSYLIPREIGIRHTPGPQFTSFVYICLISEEIRYMYFSINNAVGPLWVSEPLWCYLPNFITRYFCFANVHNHTAAPWAVGIISVFICI